MPIIKWVFRLFIPLVLIGSIFGTTDFGYKLLLISLFVYIFNLILFLIFLPNQLKACKNANEIIKNNELFSAEEQTKLSSLIISLTKKDIASSAISLFWFLTFMFNN